MKKKKIFLISGGLLTLSLVFISIILITNNSEEMIYTTNERKEINNSFLTLMLEQEDGTYQESTSNTWPGEGYIFNNELSKCQNGGELSYDSETNKVILHSNKSDGCYVYFDIYNKPIINSINLTETTNNSITINVSVTEGTNPISNYYYVINDGTPVSTTSNTYTFSGLDSDTTYTIKVYVVDSEGYSSDTSSLSVETDDTVLLAEWVINEYGGVQGNNGIYYHTSTLANGAGDNSYRYAGDNPNNYVCFGSNASPCPTDNLYRIIGVFENEVKLIKNSSIGNYVWDSENDNTWDNITKPDIYTTLNDIYYKSLGIIWQNKITIHSYKVGGTELGVPQFVYNHEVGSESSSITESMKIGLMYVSDYAYAGAISWKNDISYNNFFNWMNSKGDEWTIKDEWTISRGSTNNRYVLIIYGSARVNYQNAYETFAVRPVFYLNSDVQYISGTGTQSDPFRIE